MMSGIVIDGVEKTQWTVREANYNFETGTGIGRDGDDFGQIVNFRHPYCADFAYPLRWQFYPEMDREYVRGAKLKTEYWIPDALEQNTYTRGGDESVDGISCVKLQRAGLDTIWIAKNVGYLICRRDFHFGLNKPVRERVQNLEPKELAPGVWIPMRQIREEFDQDGSFLARFELRVENTTVGAIGDKDLEVILGERMMRIEDHITNKIYEPIASLNLDEMIEQAKKSAPQLYHASNPQRLTALLVTSNLVLAILLVVIWRRRRPNTGGPQTSSPRRSDDRLPL